MLTYIRNRLLLAIPTLILVSVVTFFMGYLAPGSPIDPLMGQHNDPATRHRLEHEYGLDRPPLVRYGSYLWGVAHGDFGKSITYHGQPINEIFAQQFPVTAGLACMTMVVALLVGLPTGVVAALKHNRLLDRLAMAGVLVLVSVPAFVLAPVLMLIFGLRLNLLPVAGWDGPANYVLPVAVLAARPAALIARFMRSSMLDVLRQDYIRTARAKGLSPGRVIWKHALKNASLPVLTIIGNSFGYLLTGSFVVETIFAIPGIGRQSVQSIIDRDYPVIQGIALLVAAIFILVNLAVDILYHVIDPRVRYEVGR